MPHVSVNVISSDWAFHFIGQETLIAPSSFWTVLKRYAPSWGGVRSRRNWPNTNAASTIGASSRRRSISQSAKIVDWIEHRRG